MVPPCCAGSYDTQPRGCGKHPGKTDISTGISAKCRIEARRDGADRCWSGAGKEMRRCWPGAERRCAGAGRTARWQSCLRSGLGQVGRCAGVGWGDAVVAGWGVWRRDRAGTGGSRTGSGTGGSRTRPERVVAGRSRNGSREAEQRTVSCVRLSAVHDCQLCTIC